MVARLLLILALLLSPLPAAAQERSSLEGSWALQVGGATIFRFDLAPAPDNDEWRGTWSRPSSFATDGLNFGRIRLPPRRVQSMAGLVFEDSVEISFPDPRPGAIPDIFRFRLIDADAAEMIYVGTGLAPYLLQRVSADTPLGPFREGATYSLRPPTEPELEAEVESEAAPNTGPVIVEEKVIEVPEDSNDFRLPPSGIQGR